MAIITFYIHPAFWPRSEIPSSPDAAWPGFAFGIYTWSIQTFLRLEAAGVDCNLASQLPDEGIVISHRECLAATDGSIKGRLMPNRRRIIVDMCADLPPYPFANAHIVQNPQMTSLGRNFLHVRHWPQPGLTPRDVQRGEEFSNVGYFGNIKNLPEPLRAQAWHKSLRNIGCNWTSKMDFFDFQDVRTYEQQNQWADYGDLDAIVAVRSVSPKHLGGFDHKPASKLYNAWLAGVPAVLGCESAYRHERRSNLDYLEVRSPEEALACVRLLKEDVDLRRRMVENGRQRGLGISADATVKDWIKIIDTQLVPIYVRWRKGSLATRGLDITRSILSHQTTRITRKLRIGKQR